MGPRPRPFQSLEGPHSSRDPGLRREARERLHRAARKPGAVLGLLLILGPNGSGG